MTVLSIARNALRPSYLPVMAHKAWIRARYGHDRERKAATAWAARHAEDVESWVRGIDPLLWREAEDFSAWLAESARWRLRKLARDGVDLGGPGGIELLYVLARLLRPAVALETGVAAGWSTSAILGAMRANGGGHLYSSDFPFFRLANPEQYIGYVIPEELRTSWTLHVKGDRRNLERILLPGVSVDLVHYDSDKSREGREFFLGRVRNHLGAGHVLVMDDIQDNLVFRRHVEGRPRYRVFEYRGKYIGMTGPGLVALEREAAGT
ncbi:class I SAM-dependent methyltransferase [Streptosporangium sp. NPDC048047]|uniref:class I SAM-dependent methyltransferase n=1 Tax=Streptosporangium sp. NPDC048047 TaxID=3155748 RepID=UPI003438891E